MGKTKRRIEDRSPLQRKNLIQDVKRILEKGLKKTGKN